MPTMEAVELTDTPSLATISDQLRSTTDAIRNEMRQIRTDLEEALQQIRSLPNGKEWVAKS